MKKILISVLIGLVSFGAGLFGLFFAMPSVAPERVREALVYVDSIRMADSLAQLGLAPSAMLQPDSAATPAASSGTHLDSSETIVEPNVTSAPLAAGQPVDGDSLGAILRRMSDLEAENRMLQTRLQALQKDSGSPAVDPAALSGTLAKLDDKELRAILQQLDPSVIEQLYLSASSKNQMRLLGSMPAEKAAGFVQGLMKGSNSQTTGVSAARNDEGGAELR